MIALISDYQCINRWLEYYDNELELRHLTQDSRLSSKLYASITEKVQPINECPTIAFQREFCKKLTELILSCDVLSLIQIWSVIETIISHLFLAQERRGSERISKVWQVMREFYSQAFHKLIMRYIAISLTFTGGWCLPPRLLWSPY